MTTNGKVLITGGAGLIGSHIAGQIASGDSGIPCGEIIVLDDFSRGTRDNLAEVAGGCPLRVVEGDIRDRGLVEEVMDGVGLVFHQAAIRITQCAQDPRLAHEVLVDGTFNVMEAAARAGVRKVVAASSASIYGMAEEFPTPESHHPYNNRTLYGAAKVYNEVLLRTFHEMFGLDYVALRYFNVYGPRMDIHGAYTEVFIRWMERIEAGKPPIIFGDGSQTMDFVNAIDIARANILAARSEATDVILNVASGEETSLKELADAIGRAMGREIEPEFQAPRAINPVPRRLAEVERTKRLIGFEAEIPLDKGLRNLVSWWRGRKAK